YLRSTSCSGLADRVENLGAVVEQVLAVLCCAVASGAVSCDESGLLVLGRLGADGAAQLQLHQPEADGTLGSEVHQRMAIVSPDRGGAECACQRGKLELRHVGEPD